LTAIPHKAGFVSIIGKPNVGKSTLMNQLVGEKLSIITSKAQTTRHRILGILSGENFQIVYSDTPGIIKPAYKLQESMMTFVKTAVSDADIIIYIVELGQKFDPDDEVIRRIKKSEKKLILVINKVDLDKDKLLESMMAEWQVQLQPDELIPVSALKSFNINFLLDAIINLLPEHPAYFPKDEITDKPERFFAAEIVREKIFLNYKQEVPYSSEVVITDFKEDEKIIRIRAEIYVERDSQKGILIGKGGRSLKKVGIESRADMEKFFGKQIHIETFVKVEPDWRKKITSLKKFGY
jgi:GTP-binding protein Era